MVSVMMKFLEHNLHLVELCTVEPDLRFKFRGMLINIATTTSELSPGTDNLYLSESAASKTVFHHRQDSFIINSNLYQHRKRNQE